MRLESDGGGGRSRRDMHMSIGERRARNRSLCSLLCTPPPYPGYSAWMGSLSQLKVEDIDVAENAFSKGPPPEFLRSISSPYSSVSVLSVSIYETPRPKNLQQRSPPMVSPDDFDLRLDVELSSKQTQASNPSASSGYGSASSESDHENAEIMSVSLTHANSAVEVCRRRPNRIKSSAEKEIEKQRRRSVPASLRSPYTDDVLRVLELDGHIRFQTDVDSGERMPVIDMRGIRQNESVLDLARKFAEINAQQEKARLHSSWNQPIPQYAKSGPTTPVKQSTSSTGKSVSSLLKKFENSSDNIKNERTKTVSGTSEKNSPAPKSPPILPNRNLTKKAKVSEDPKVKNVEPTNKNSPKVKELNFEFPEKDEKNIESTTVKFSVRRPSKPHLSIENEDLPPKRPLGMRRNRPKTMDSGQLKKIHLQAFPMENDSEMGRPTNSEKIVKVELPENIDDEIEKWKNLTNITTKTTAKVERKTSIREEKAARSIVMGGIASLGDKPRMAATPQNPWKAMPKGGSIVRPTNPNSIKDALLRWIQSKVQDYPIEITNFSSSWADGMAFCALIHRFAPNAFDYSKLDKTNRRANLELAFRVAEDNGVCPLLEVDDMIMMGDRPDWKCVFTYVQSFYKEFRNRP